jgi:TRAP-type C4-dicarboxylate transport system permease small subunit
MRRLLFALNYIHNHVLLFLNYISVIIIFLTALWITGDVVGRYFFNSPIPGTTELIKTGILGIVFFGIAYTLQQGRHIRTDVFLKHLPSTIIHCGNALGCLIGAIMFALVFKFGWEEAWKAWVVKEFEGVQLQVPTYPSYFIMVLGSGLLVIQFTIDLIRNVQAALSRKKSTII